jgi:hypothetical protein
MHVFGQMALFPFDNAEGKVLRPSLFDSDNLSLADIIGVSKYVTQLDLNCLPPSVRFVFQQFHRIDEVALPYRHNQVYWVEVFPAIKTTCQIGFWICCRVKVAAQGAAKAQQRIGVAQFQP